MGLSRNNVRDGIAEHLLRKRPPLRSGKESKPRFSSHWGNSDLRLLQWRWRETRTQKRQATILRECRACQVLRYLPPYDPLEPRPDIAEHGELGLSRASIILSPAPTNINKVGGLGKALPRYRSRKLIAFPPEGGPYRSLGTALPGEW